MARFRCTLYLFIRPFQAAEFGFTGMTHRAARPGGGLFDGAKTSIVTSVFQFAESDLVVDHHQRPFSARGRRTFRTTRSNVLRPE